MEHVMGYGDEIIASGMARGAKARGKLIAFGDGKVIRWGPHSEIIFQGNPNVARPGSERTGIALEWIAHYKHHRLYFSRSADGSRWVYDRNFRIISGEIWLSDDERRFAAGIEPGILIEPRVKDVYPNKQWPVHKYAEVAQRLVKVGYRVYQFKYDARFTPIASGVIGIVTPTIRHALAALSRMDLYIGCEGGLAHGAAAFGVNSVVLFGGFTDPEVLGYKWNANLTGGVEPCGRLSRCDHCRDAMRAIAVEDVIDHAQKFLLHP